MHPDWVDKVTLVQVILPSANDHLQNVRSLVMCEIDKIRSLFGNKVQGYDAVRLKHFKGACLACCLHCLHVFVHCSTNSCI
jgi:trehalose-6-phosphate synthase